MRKAVEGNLTVLTDNVVPGKSEFVAEHGISFYIETGIGHFLFDTGKGKTIIHNAAACHKDLKSLNKIILSHSHHDHTGGLPEVLRATKCPINVYAHPDVFVPKYRKKDDSEIDDGIPFTRSYLERMGAHFIFNEEYVQIEEGISLTGEVPRQTNFEVGDMDNRYAKVDGKEKHDIIRDDQSMVIHTHNGLMIVLGCAHSGIINVLNHIINKSGTDEIYAIIGGTHIGFAEKEQLDETIKALKNLQIKHLIPSHCTGQEGISRLRFEFEDIFHFSHVGFTLGF